MQSSALYVGVDVSRDELVVAIAGRHPDIVANTANGIASLLNQLPTYAHIAMESTGHYHTALAQMSSERGLTVYVLNARDVLFYARALGSRAKTDRVDAAVIARYVQEHHAKLHPWQAPTAVQLQLHQLLARRAKVVDHRTALHLAFVGVDIPNIDLQALHAGFDAWLKSIDREIQRLIDSDEQLQQGYRRLLSISGVGEKTAALLTELLSRIPFTNADSLVAYSGLDPRPNDSGTKRGRRRLSKKGPALLRRQMYLAGMAAARSRALSPLYRAIRAKGFSGTEAAVILGRKLLRIAYSLWKSGQTFDPTRFLIKTG